MRNGLSEIKKVVDGGYCVGCGACAFVAKTPMQLNEYGEFLPDLSLLESNISDLSITNLDKVCPFLAPDINESVIATEIYGQDSNFHETLGYYKECYAGVALESDFREKGTSGGMGTWVATELLRQGLIDGVIHVKQSIRSDQADPFYKYGISMNENEIRDASKTRYHVVEISEVLALIKKTEGRFMFIGVPCMCKAIRRLQIVDSTIKEKIPFLVSLVCGHLKSVNWSLSLAWGAEIEPSEASTIQYRTKGDGIPARAYYFRASSNDGTTVQKNSATVAGGKYNAGALMLPACEFCDDVIGETSDLTIGDAWLPRFEADENGTNLLVVRNGKINKLLQGGIVDKKIRLEVISPDDAVASQSGGYRQRREGLSYRLEREQAKGKWVPEKRVRAGDFKLTKSRKIIYDKRSEVTSVSRKLFVEALQKNDFSIYSKKVAELAGDVRRKEIKNMLPKLLANKIQRVGLKVLKKLHLY